MDQGKKKHRRTGKKARSKRPLKLSLRQQQVRNDAFEALRMMRTRGWSLAHAAREAGDSGRDPRTVKRHVGKALTKWPNGRYAAKPSDRLPRYLEFLTPKGNITLKVQGSRKASLIGEYFDAVKRYLSTGESDGLRKFQGKSIQVGKEPYPFITDLHTLERLGNAGVVSFENLYALGT